ncbi:MAG: DNA mismatch repair endonuclease MutL [Armatimonadota bacterium]
MSVLDSAEPVEHVPSVVNLLDENTANRIAAGEVIERPSSVVKELVENSLDAGATRIEVELEEGGKRRILVRDNGSGMGREDAVLSLQRHATSKISSADDLFSIHTLGFRGEALPSIASVSDFHLITKRRGDDAASEIIARGGNIITVQESGALDGTTITVENLFFNTPARLKFLKTTQTELNHAVDLIHRLMLAYHGISFRLVHDGYEMIAYPGASDPRHAVAAVWGRDTARDMVPIRYDSPAISVRGFVSKPSLSKATRNSQATFVNGRFVRSRTVTHAFDSAFKNLMTTDRHPVLALFVEIAPELVDVNVHPAKTEVRFTRDGDVYGAVHKAVESALLTGGLVPEVTVQSSLPLRGEERGSLPPRAALSSWGKSEVELPAFEPDGGSALTAVSAAGLALISCPSPADGRGESGSKPASAAHEGGSEAADALPSGSPRPLAGEGQGMRANPAAEAEGQGARASEEPSYIGFDGHRISRLRVLAQSRNTYIVAETDDALLLIDQHIAHERVLYEQMMNGAEGRARDWGVVSQHLALPQTLELGPGDARVAGERLSALEKAGFLLEPFGRETFVVRAVPAVIAHKDYLQTLREIIDDMASVSSQRRLLVPHESAVIMASCKMAVKKGDPLTMEEMTRLLSDLAKMQNPFTCPHGRPILLALPHREMDRKFHRIGPH